METKHPKVKFEHPEISSMDGDTILSETGFHRYLSDVGGDRSSDLKTIASYLESLGFVKGYHIITEQQIKILRYVISWFAAQKTF